MNGEIRAILKRVLQECVKEYPGARDGLQPAINKLGNTQPLSKEDKEQIAYWIEWISDAS